MPVITGKTTFCLREIFSHAHKRKCCSPTEQLSGIDREGDGRETERDRQPAPSHKRGFPYEFRVYSENAFSSAISIVEPLILDKVIYYSLGYRGQNSLSNWIPYSS